MFAVSVKHSGSDFLEFLFELSFFPIKNLLFVSRCLQNANGVLSRSANQMPVFLALGQSGVNNFALVRKKIKK